MSDPGADPQLWWGRVFGLGSIGGNHTVVVRPGTWDGDRAEVARRLAVPDTAFLESVTADQVTLRTFSPVEELAQCLQTSLASVGALDLPDGADCNVCHQHGEPLVVHREGRLAWAQQQSRSGRREPVELPGWLKEQLPRAAGMRVQQARPRVLVRCRSAAEVVAAVAEPAAVLALGRDLDANGLVFYAHQDGVLRLRVFTSSLAGTEDNATGGAVLDVGTVLAADGVHGEVSVVQGPPDPARQGHLRLRLGETVLLGGEVSTLARGSLVIE